MRLTKTSLAVFLAAGIASCSGGNSIVPQTAAPQTTIGQSSSNLNGTSGFSTFRMRPNTNPAYLTVAGPVVATFSGGFTITTGSTCPGGGNLHIYTSSSTTYSGPRPAVGSTTKVYGQGSCSSAVAAITVTATSGSSTVAVPAHINTADFLGYPYGTSKISWSSAAPYLTWAQTGIKSATAIHNAGIKTQLYSDPNVTANDGDPLYTSNESTFAHTCGGSRVSYAYDGHIMYHMAIGTSAMQSLYANWISREKSLAHFDVAVEDNAGPIGSSSSLPCGYTTSTWLSYGRALNEAAPLPVLFNGLSALYNQGPSLSLGLLSSSNTVGGNFEHCYSDNSTPKMHSWVWQATETTEIDVANLHKFFQCQARNTNSASSSADARIYTLASFLLSYNPSTSVLWEEFATPSGFHVMPESGLVPLSPKIVPTSLSSLRQSGGTYARQFGACYFRKASVGPCAVVVNPDTVSHPFPYTAYHHRLVLSGSGVLDGGAAYRTGSAPPTSLPAQEAAIVFL